MLGPNPHVSDDFAYPKELLVIVEEGICFNSFRHDPPFAFELSVEVTLVEVETLEYDLLWRFGRSCLITGSGTSSP